MVKIEIDKVEGEVPLDLNVIEAARYIGVDIPHFCYHRRLTIAANCRMCLVEVVGVKKLVPACATKISDNMKIYTRSEFVLSTQRAMMEFLLINHPLDCPICDQGGECELQDISVSYGSSKTRFIEGKRIFFDTNLGPLIVSNMSRCIMCTRCIRFGTEIAGISDFGKIGRGVYSRVATFLQSTLSSSISCNVIDLCPVGALCSKPFKFRARAWELIKLPTISPHDCVGSNIYTHVKNGEIFRITPRENDFINETWISDRDRFGFEGIYHHTRMTNSFLKVDNNMWKCVSLKESLSFTAQKILKYKEMFGADEIACIISPNCSNEEMFLFQKLFKIIGIENIDHRIQQVDFKFEEKYPMFLPGIIDLQKIEKQSCILLVDFDISKEQPIACVRVTKQQRNGGCVFSISSEDFNFPFILTTKKVTKNITIVLRNILHCLQIDNNFDLQVNEILFEENIIAKTLLSSAESLILLGENVTHSVNYSDILELCGCISSTTGCKVGILPKFSNTLGGLFVHCVPLKNDMRYIYNQKNTYEFFLNKKKVYCLFNIDPEIDFSYSKTAIESLGYADFVVSFTSFDNDLLRHLSNVLIPVASFYEIEGTFISITGVNQYVRQVSSNERVVSSIQGWRVLVLLATFFDVVEFLYKHLDEVTKEIYLRFSKIKKEWCNVGNFILPYSKNKEFFNKKEYSSEVFLRNVYHDNISCRSLSLCKLK